MKKQFLLVLMAMLLPFAAWAQDELTVTLASKSTTYAGDNTAQPQIRSVVVTEGESSVTSYEVAYTFNGEPVEQVRDAGEYTVTVTASEGTGTATYTVQKAVLTVTAANMWKEYGTPDDEVEDVAWAPLNDLKVGDTKDNVIITGLKFKREKGYDGEDVGEDYKISLVGSTGTADNYTITATGGVANLAITPKELTVKFEGLEFAYGDIPVEGTDEYLKEKISVTGDGYVRGDTDESVELTWVLTENKLVHDAGSYTIKAVIESENYTLADPSTTEFTISPVALTVKAADDLKKTYGMNDPNLTASATEWKYEDEKTATFTLTRDEGEDVGVYQITGCELDEANSKNYTIDEQESYGTLTIEAKSLADEDIEIEVAEADQVYQGQAADFSLSSITVKYTGAEIETIKDAALTDEFDYTFTYTDGVKNAGSDVTVTVTAVSKDEDTQKKGNYEGIATYEFKIAKAPLTIATTDQTISFDATKTADEQIDQTQYTVTESQLKAGDTKEALQISLYLDDEAAKGVLGTYEHSILFKADGDIAANYDYETSTTEESYGTLTINTGKAKDNSIIIGRDEPNTSKILEAYNGFKTFDEKGDYNGSGGFTVIVKENRTVNADQWYTMVLPFDISVRDFSKIMGYAVVDVPNEANDKDGVVSFKLHTGTIKANTLFLFKTDEARNLSSNPLNFKLQWGVASERIGDGYVVINYDPEYCVTDAAGNEYHGIYERKEFTEDGYWYLASGTFHNAGAYYREYDEPAVQQALQGYVYTPAGAAARILIEEPDGSTTVINAVNADAAANAEGWYTIGGVKLTAEPTQKGIYINNGKKVVIK